MKVFEKSITQEVIITNIADNGRNFLQSGFLRSAESALPHNQLVGRLLRVNDADHYWLKDADFLDGRDQLSESVFVENITGLTWVRRNLLNRDQAERGARNVLEVGFT